MKFQTVAILCGAISVFLASNAFAAHPSLVACGGLAANKKDGVQLNRHFSRRQEKAIEEFLQEAGALPGVAIAIVRDESIVYARGFGFRDLGSCDKVTSDTRFYLKSTTKHFLGAAAAILHEEGAIELDAPVSEYLPNLLYPEGVNTTQASIRAHLTHTNPTFSAGLNYRSAFPGNLPEKDFVPYLNEWSEPKNIRFRYSNVGPIIAAHAIEAKTGSNWREFIREKVFEPAGMYNSFTVMIDAKKGPMATGYLGGHDNEFKTELTKVDSQMHAAGGAVSTAADMARWLMLNLNFGKIDGKQALSRRAIEQTHARQVQLQAEFSEYKRFAYGLGLYAADYDGDLLMHHFGGETHMSFMPEHGLGVVVLTNELGFGGRVTHALASTIYDMLLEKEDVEVRIARRLKEISESKTLFKKRLDQYLKQVKKNAPVAPPELFAGDLIGEFRNERLGTMSVLNGENGLSVSYGAINGSLEHLGGDTYLADIGLWNSMPPQVFTFRRNERNEYTLDWGGRIFVRRR